jgi:photosystem II stability/assembly factor-like uncharacterized protein
VATATPAPSPTTAQASPLPTPTPSPKPRLFAQNSGAGGTLEAVQFLDAQAGYAVGPSGTVLKTVNAGATWKAVAGEALADKDVRDLSFVDANTGWLVSNDGVLHTKDGGETWVQQLPEDYSTVRFVSAERGYISGYRGFFETQDGGTTWTEHEGASSYFSIAVKGETLFGVKNGELHRFTPGLGWGTSHSFDSFGYGRERVFFLTATEGWLHTKDGLLHTTDGGDTWTKVAAAPLDAENALVFFASPKVGWLRYQGVGVNSGSFYRTLDGGKTWQEIELPFNAYVTAFWFTDEATGWLVGGDGKIWRYAVQ